MEYKYGNYKKELSQREKEVIEHVIIGYTDKEIGTELGISPRTVTGYMSNILLKLDAINRVDAAVKYYKQSQETKEQGNCQKPIGV